VDELQKNQTNKKPMKLMMETMMMTPAMWVISNLKKMVMMATKMTMKIQMKL
jgi:hypothetical protein